MSANDLDQWTSQTLACRPMDQPDSGVPRPRQTLFLILTQPPTSTHPGNLEIDQAELALAHHAAYHRNRSLALTQAD